MQQLLERNFITTKDAGKLSGYTSDYLSRLVRSGKIVGEKVGRSWVIDKDSLAHFLEAQRNHKIERAHSLANERTREYRTHHSLLHRATETLTAPIPVSKELGIASASLVSHATALIVASLVVTFGAFGAQVAIISQLADTTATLAHEVSLGFDATFGDIPENIAMHIITAENEMSAHVLKVKDANTNTSASFTSTLLTEPDLSVLRMPLDELQARHTVPEPIPGLVSDASMITEADAQAFARNIYTFVTLPAYAANAIFTSPSQVADAFANTYVMIGKRAYTAIGASFAAYDGLIEETGVKTLSLAASARDLFATTPDLVSRMNLSLGESVIDATHAAIHADVVVAYALAEAAPVSARAAVTLIGTAGDMLEYVTARAPAFAATLFLRTTEAPARIAPAIAQTIFNVEYAGATRFLAAAHAASQNYLTAIRGMGYVAYRGAATIRSVPVMLNEVYLGMLGKSANETDTLPRLPVLAAALSSPSVGEQVTHIIYDAVRVFFSSTSDALTALFGSTNIL